MASSRTFDGQISSTMPIWPAGIPQARKREMPSCKAFPHFAVLAWLIGGTLGAGAGAADSATPTSGSAQTDPGRPPERSGARFLSFQKPAWLTELSVGVRQSYDNNVFLSGASSPYLPRLYTLPVDSAPALKGVGSWVTTVSPRISVNVAPLLATESLQVLSLGYAPDFANYYEAPSEDYNAHRFPAAIKAQAGAFALALENNVAYVDGNTVAPTYPGGFYSAIGIAAPRQRREQIQDRLNVTLRYDGDWWFIRPAASLLYYDMKTELMNVLGYQNYCDRYDVNGGADLGWKIAPKMAATLGYRYGYQGQQQFSFSPYSSPSDYQRLLVGFEGTPWNWLEVRIVGGPDFRVYEGDTLAHITPVSDKTPVKYYGDAMLAAKLSPKDTLIFKAKQFQWLSSLGKVPYYDSIYDLSYHRVLTTHLGAELGFRAWDADYNSGNLPACRRNDWQYTCLAGLTYTFSTHFSANLAYSLDLGRNAQADVINPQGREYNQNLVSLGVMLSL
jgi:hypothetical protein